MQIHRLPALSDNYIFLLYEQPQEQTNSDRSSDRQRGIAAVIDPAEAAPVLKALQQLQADLVAILNTHHHGDHVGGNAELLRQFPDAVVYGGAADRGRIPGQQVFLEEGDRVQFGRRSAEVLFVPGHTRAHIAYYFPPVELDQSGGKQSDQNQADQNRSDQNQPDKNQVSELFCGDTLFAGGCGRLFEGTPSQMVTSLSKLRALPDQTRVWCAHEYTLKNLQFACRVDPNNRRLQDRLAEVEQQRQQSIATVPSWLGEEKRTNPFLRWDQPELQAATEAQSPVQTFARLRGMKDQF